jgi:hypothetical protein
MTEPAPVTPLVPAEDHESRFRAWYEKHVCPDVADIRIKTANAGIDAGKALDYLRVHAQVVSQVAAVVAGLAKDNPELGPDAVAAAEEAARIAAEIAAAGL